MQIRDLEYWYYKVVEWRSEIRIKILDDNNLTSFLNSQIKGKQNKTVSKSKGDKGFFFFYLWWILSYIEMKQPWVYMCSPSQSPLPPPSPPVPSRFSQCTRSERCLMHPTWAGDLFHPR